MPTQDQVHEAEKQLLVVSDRQEAWSPKELRQQATDGLPFEVISLAFWRLLNRGELVLDDGLVRRAHG